MSSHSTPLLQTIAFYDILANVPEKSVSPFTAVTHWSLLYKGLPFERKLIEFVDVAPVSAKIGFNKTTSPSGDKMYTFPAIEDPNTGAKVADSFAIAEYLDATYSGKGQPLLIPPGTKTLQKAFLTTLQANLSAIFVFALPAVHPHITERSVKHWVASKEAIFGKKIDEIRPKGDEEIKEWAKVKQIFETWNGWYDDNAGNSKYITGATPVLVDFYLAGYLYVLRAGFGRESREWKDISSWNGGRWAKFLDRITQEYPLK